MGFLPVRWESPAKPLGGCEGGLLVVLVVVGVRRDVRHSKRVNQVL